MTPTFAKKNNNMDVLEKLKRIDYKNCTPEDVRMILTNVAVPCVPFYIKKGIYILRGRRGAGFTKRSQMTYCPADKCISMQRASLPQETMFYGVVSDNQSHQENARAIITSECSKLCRDGTNSIGRESFSIAHWEVVKPLHIVSLICDDTFEGVKDNTLLNQLREAFILFHGEKISTNINKDISKFISSEFAKTVKDESEYLISATIATDIIKEMNYDGIVYPSVQLGGKAGLNIALTPKAVNRKLRFRRTIEQTLYKNGGKSFVRIEKAEGKKLSPKQIPDNYIEKDLNINSLEDLPTID